MLVARDVVTTRITGRDNVSVFIHAGRSVVLASVMASVIACAPTQNVAYEPVRPAAEMVQASPLLMIKKDIDLVRLEGALGSAEQLALASAQAADLFGAEMVINDLKVDPSLSDAQWLGAVFQIVENMQQVDGFSLAAGGGQVTVGGAVDSKAMADEISNMASDLAGLSLAVSSTLAYPVDATLQVVTDADVNIESVVPANGAVVAVMPLAVLEQEVVAVQQVSMPAMPAVALAQNPESVVVEVPASMLQSELDGDANANANANVDLDTDGDGVADSVDGCDSRPGYPVNASGCQSLDGYLKDIRFYGDSDQLSEAAKGSLDIIAFTLLDHPVSKMAVLSYSKDGAPALMRAQARKRAYSVVDYLVAKGVDQNRLQAFALAHRKGTPAQIAIKEID